jgi:hypothetical protein
MANRDELKQQRDADARVALLGLAANRQGTQQGRCLASQEMAELLDGKCESDQRRLHLKHLSTCETCYREWLDLQQELSHASLKQKKPLLFQRRVLTFSGSLLAAAASVVFYLNLLDTSPKSEESLIHTIPQFEKEQSSNVSDIPLQQKSFESFSKPAPVTTQSKLQFDEVQTESVQEKVKREFVKPSGQVPIRTKNMAASAMALDPIQQWIQQVQKKCAEESSGPVVWQDLVLQGKALSSRETFSKFESILVKLNQLVAGESQKPVCAEIQQILREKNNEQ